MAIAVVVGNVIGSGIFLKPGNIAAYSSNFTLILSVWVAAGALCVLGAMCIAELATMHPRAGGLYVYLYEAYGKLIAFLFGWTEFLLLRPASIGALAVAFVSSLCLAMDWAQSSLLQLTLCSVLILGMAWVNVLGVIWGGRLQLATTIVKAGFLALVALSPLLALPFQSDLAGAEVAAEIRTVAPISELSLGAQVGAILLAVMWAYDGWHGITPLSEEVREPQRNIPIALFGGIGILIALYVGANLAYHRVLSMDEMRAAGDHAAEQMLFKLTGPIGRSAMSLVIMCSTFGAINSNLLMAPRITFAMSRDRLFFASFGRVHATFRTPVIAILATSLMAVALIGATTLAKVAVATVDPTAIQGTMGRRIVESLHLNSTFELMTNFFTFSASVFYLLAVFAVMVLRWRAPQAKRSYHVWGYPVVPLVFVAVYVWFLAQAYSSNPVESRAGVGFILLGIPVFYLYQTWIKRERHAPS